MEHAPSWLINSLIYLGAAVIAVPVSKALGLGSIIGYFGGQKGFCDFYALP